MTNEERQRFSRRLRERDAEIERQQAEIELNPAYAAMSSNRIKDDAPLFAEVAQP